MKFQITHTTCYRYTQAVTLCHNEVHLCPRSDTGQACESNVLTIEPMPTQLHWRTDYFGNQVTYFAVHNAHRALTVTAHSRVQRLPKQQPQFAASMPWDQVFARLHEAVDGEAWMARELILDSPLIPRSPALRDYSLASFEPGRPLLEAVADLAGRIHRDFAYTPDFTTVSTPLAKVLEHRRGVCQDFAHLAIGCLRSLGLPARYVSGYLETLPAPGAERLRGADTSHAWFAVFEPDIGWIDVDPTNNQFVAQQHVALAYGRDYSDVTPLKGVVFGGGTPTLEVSVDVTVVPGTGEA